MLLQEYLCETHQYATPEQWGSVRDSLPQEWVQQALLATGVSTLRKRRLPMEQVLWLVLGIALLRDRSILHVADALEVALPTSGEGISSSALSQARQRLGCEPLQWL
ncbi:transposase domain-containing protein, partial [Uliginosibacterium paludis]